MASSPSGLRLLPSPTLPHKSPLPLHRTLHHHIDEFLQPGPIATLRIPAALRTGRYMIHVPAFVAVRLTLARDLPTSPALRSAAHTLYPSRPDHA